MVLSDSYLRSGVKVSLVIDLLRLVQDRDDGAMAEASLGLPAHPVWGKGFLKDAFWWHQAAWRKMMHDQRVKV